MQQSLVASRQKVPQDAGRVCGRESTRCLVYVLAVHDPWEASIQLRAVFMSPILYNSSMGLSQIDFEHI